MKDSDIGSGGGGGVGGGGGGGGGSDIGNCQNTGQTGGREEQPWPDQGSLSAR